MNNSLSHRLKSYQVCLKIENVTVKKTFFKTGKGE